MPRLDSSCLSPTEIQTMRAAIEQCILVLDRGPGGKQERELALRAKLVALHAEIERLDLDSSPPFSRPGA